MDLGWPGLPGLAGTVESERKRRRRRLISLISLFGIRLLSAKRTSWKTVSLVWLQRIPDAN